AGVVLRAGVDRRHHHAGGGRPHIDCRAADRRADHDAAARIVSWRGAVPEHFLWGDAHPHLAVPAQGNRQPAPVAPPGRRTAMTALLQVRDLSKTFGGLKAVRDLSFDVHEGEIVGLIGPNGAGKSTAFNLITCTHPATSGSVRFDGRELLGLTPSQVVQHGLARTFQSASVYANATVRENVFRGAISKLGTPLLSQLFGTPSSRRRLSEIDAEIDEILDIAGLSEVRDLMA